jgi:hypothetical protein
MEASREIKTSMFNHAASGNTFPWISAILVAALASAAARAADYPFSLQLEVLERDLASADYQAIVKTMISTELAAEWRRVATPDNYHLFARQNGGLEKVHLFEVLAGGLASMASNPDALVLALHWGPGLASGVLDNVPLALAMTFVLKDLAAIPGYDPALDQ